MEITIKLFASFRLGRFREEAREYPQNTMIRQIVDDLQISRQSVGIVLLNGVHSHLDQVLSEGATVSLLPLMGGG